MGDLMDAMRTETGLTENGMTTNTTTLNSCVDLFFQIGAMRGQDEDRLISLFTLAYTEDPLIAMKLLFWARDIRGGAGERRIFRVIAEYLANNHRETIRKNLNLIPEFGRWDDLFVFFGTKLEGDVLEIIADGLSNDNTKGLCSKWLPRLNTKKTKNKIIANSIRKSLKLSPKEYRKMLSENSNTVEQLMCGKNFNEIDYGKLPSKAMSDYMKAFSKNDGERFGEYLESVKSGNDKINAGAVYPYDIIKNLKQGNTNGADIQWNALPNYLEGNTERVLPLVDSSGSMKQHVGKNKNLMALDIAISLGMYIAERNVGVFKDGFMTFNSSSKLIYLKGSLTDRAYQLRRAPWGGSTNLISAFDTILNQAVKFNVVEDEMPTMLLILSDMEFNSATHSSRWDMNDFESWNPTAQQAIAEKYEAAGYSMPKIVYWNLAARHSNFPVQFQENGTALVSGFSPAILKGLLSGDNMNPQSMMMKVIDDERYSNITI